MCAPPTMAHTTGPHQPRHRTVADMRARVTKRLVARIATVLAAASVLVLCVLLALQVAVVRVPQNATTTSKVLPSEPPSGQVSDAATTSLLPDDAIRIEVSNPGDLGDISWFTPPTANVTEQGAPPPAALVARAGNDPVVTLAEVVNLPAETPHPPQAAVLVYAGVTASFYADEEVVLTWSYDALIPPEVPVATIESAVDRARWSLVSASPATVQVGPEALEGTVYQFAAVDRQNGMLEYRILRRSDGAYMTQVVHRGLHIAAVPPDMIAPPLQWVSSVPMPDAAAVQSLVLDIRRSDQFDVWSGSLSMLMLVPNTEPEAVVAQIRDTPPAGFSAGTVTPPLSDVRFRAPDGTVVTAEVYKSGSTSVVEWYMWMGPSTP